MKKVYILFIIIGLPLLLFAVSFFEEFFRLLHDTHTVEFYDGLDFSSAEDVMFLVIFMLIFFILGTKYGFGRFTPTPPHILAVTTLGISLRSLARKEKGYLFDLIYFVAFFTIIMLFLWPVGLA